MSVTTERNIDEGVETVTVPLNDIWERYLKRIEEKTEGKEEKFVLYFGWRSGTPLKLVHPLRCGGVETERNIDIGEYEFSEKNGVIDGLATFTRSDGEKCYENWKDGEKCNSELHTDLPESLSAKLTLKEFEEKYLNEPDRVTREKIKEELAKKVQEELDKHDDYFPTDQT
jgi:hypothetical protein